MQYRPLGNTDIRVSVICLGTMTWGQQNTEADGHAQMDYAIDHGVNFIDTAEMYAVPARAETQGRTEEIIGTWLAADPSRREKIVLATKVTGRSDMDWIRKGGTRVNREQIMAAIDGSLKRLQTDYVDLYQVHWPDRKTNFFGQLGYSHDPDDVSTPILEQLEALADLVKAGKVRHIGLSNETPWGVMQFLRLAETAGLPRVVSIQNPYNLLNRSFEIGLAEIAIRERVGLLAYSPLAMGALSGKYIDGNPPGARHTLFPHLKRYFSDKGKRATEKYVALARDHGLDPAQMALAYVNSRPFVTANIIGATNLEQLATDIASIDIELPEEVLEGIERIHQEDPNPCP